MMAECGLADKHGYVGYVPQNSRYPSHTKPVRLLYFNRTAFSDCMIGILIFFLSARKNLSQLRPRSGELVNGQIKSEDDSTFRN